MASLATKVTKMSFSSRTPNIVCVQCIFYLINVMFLLESIIVVIVHSVGCTLSSLGQFSRQIFYFSWCSTVTVRMHNTYLYTNNKVKQPTLKAKIICELCGTNIKKWHSSFYGGGVHMNIFLIIFALKIVFPLYLSCTTRFSIFICGKFYRPPFALIYYL